MNNKKILCVCTETHTGMRDFALPLIRAAARNFEVYSLFVVNPSKPVNLRKMIDNEHSVIVEQPNNKVLKVLNRLYSFSLKHEIDHLCKERNIKTVWLMTGDTMVAPFLSHLINRYDVYYTVHDLFPHADPNRKGIKKIIYYFMFQRHFDKLLSLSTNLITSSKSQYEYMLNNMPSKKAYFHPFPSLINKSITHMRCPELGTEVGYILYFSYIAHYKGVDLLYKAFVNSPKLQKFKLVIAGQGDIYFVRETSKENNVIFINRFIKDEEIPQLFKDAKAVVLPYRSATQSGNTSYVYYFNKRLLLSDIPYFRDVAEEGETALFFKSENMKDLQGKLEQLMFKTDADQMKKAQKEEYRRLYSPEGLSEYVKKIFD